MGKFSDGDPSYLLHEQYVDDANLSARLSLHDRFSINRTGWHRWVFDQLELHHGESVLETACGPGALWSRNADRLAPDIELVVTDFSAGMVHQARRALHQFRRVRGEVADVQALPFDDGAFDVVICNHALYHVPDRARAVSEIRRVLHPTGRAFVATNGRAHLLELDALRQRHLPHWEGDDTAAVFGLESGETQLAAAFEEIELRRYRDELRVTDVEPLVAYVRSSATSDDPGDAHGIAALAAEVQAEIDTTGSFTVTKDSGLFVCS